MPYLAMMDRLRAFLKQPSSALVISGYSFRDEHINEVIVQGLQATQTAVAFALLFEDLSKYPKAVKLASERTNLTLLARDAAVVSGRESKWPEREADAAAADAVPWVSWVSVNPKEEKGRLEAVFHLGDYAVLGDFLHALVGHIRQAQEAPNVK